VKTVYKSLQVHSSYFMLPRNQRSGFALHSGQRLNASKTVTNQTLACVRVFVYFRVNWHIFTFTLIVPSC